MPIQPNTRFHSEFPLQLDYLDKKGVPLTLPTTQAIIRNAYMKLAKSEFSASSECYDTLAARMSDQDAEDFDAGKKGPIFSSSFVCKYLKSLEYTRKSVLTKSSYNINAYIAFIYMLLHIIISEKLEPSQILNLDETGVFFAMAILWAYTKNGKNQLVAKEKDEKKRMTVLLTIAMNGVKFAATCITKSLAKKRKFTQNTFPDEANASNFDVNYSPTKIDVKVKSSSTKSVSAKKRKTEVKPSANVTVQLSDTRTSTRYTSRVHNNQNDSDYEDSENDSDSEDEENSPLHSLVEEYEDDPDFDDAMNDDEFPDLAIFGNIRIKDDLLDIKKLFSESNVLDEFLEIYNHQLSLKNPRVERQSGKRPATAICTRLHNDVNIKSAHFSIFLSSLQALARNRTSEVLFDLALYLESLKDNGDVNNTVNLAMIKYHAAKLCVSKTVDPGSLFTHFKDHHEVISAIDEMMSSPYIENLLNHPPTQPQEKMTSVYSTQHSNAWATAESLIPAISETVLNAPHLQGKPFLLTMDNFSCHHDKQLLDEIKESGGTILFLPPNSTNELQPLDLRTNADFKAKLKRTYHLRYLEYLNKKRPDYLQSNDRQELNVLQAWNEVSPAVVRGGFTQMFTNIRAMVEELKLLPRSDNQQL